MSPKLFLLAALLAALGPVASAQTTTSPTHFRMVMPDAPGAIVINTTGGWVIDHTMLTNNGKRPVIQLHNEALGIEVSYILDHDPPYYESTESCRNDALGTIMHGPLAKAKVTHKEGGSRTLKNGETLLVGSYLIEKMANFPANQENVFGFLTHDHTCASIHLSRTGFKPGEEKLFDAPLDAFVYEPEYLPTPEDKALMAQLLPKSDAKDYEK